MCDCACRQTFGEASLPKVREELAGYSDHKLHEFACQHGSAWQQYRLPETAMLQSAKFQVGLVPARLVCQSARTKSGSEAWQCRAVHACVQNCSCSHVVTACCFLGVQA